MSRSTPFLMGSVAASATSEDAGRLALSAKATAMAMDDFRNSRRDELHIVHLDEALGLLRVAKYRRDHSVEKTATTLPHSTLNAIWPGRSWDPTLQWTSRFHPR